MRRIFTFWEPAGRMPGYIRACLDTWKGRLPDCETQILDYSNLGDWLDDDERRAVLWDGMTLAMQSDCIRCAVLCRHGGVWMDADTVLTRPLDGRFSKADVTMVARRIGGGIVNYGAFVNAARPGAAFMRRWREALGPRVAKARERRDSALFRILHRRERRLMLRWDYCVNAIIDPLAAAASPEDYAWIDRDEICALPEEALMTSGLDAVAAYRKYWFEPGDPADVLERCAGIVMLHNSFTPPEFRAMSKDDFLAADTRLSALLRRLLA